MNPNTTNLLAEPTFTPSTAPFVCPACSGTYFARDTASDLRGKLVILSTVRCYDQHGTGCRWRGQWPPLDIPDLPRQHASCEADFSENEEKSFVSEYPVASTAFQASTEDSVHGCVERLIAENNALKLQEDERRKLIESIRERVRTIEEDFRSLFGAANSIKEALDLVSIRGPIAPFPQVLYTVTLTGAEINLMRSLIRGWKGRSL